MTGRCAVCGKYGIVERHHIIHGRGKRKRCETEQSVISLCPDCHRGTYGVHGKHGKALDMELKRRLQAGYFRDGYDEEAVREMMGGKLVLDEKGEIAGARKDSL